MNWMKALSDCYLQIGTRYPGEPLMLVSDIDGTIIDMRYLVLSVLQSYDEERGTAYFTRLRPSDVTVHENHIEQILEGVAVPASERPAVIDWYLERRWQEDTILATHRPFPGVFPMIRWFQLQPNTSVGLLTGRPEKLRDVTLRSLNRLGEPHQVHFSTDLLIMNPGDWDQDVEATKATGLQHFQDKGYHVFAMIDNEPSTLEALVPAAEKTGMLLLHADTIFESGPVSVPQGTARGNNYGLTDLVASEEALPSDVQLVWHGVNDPDNLRQFFASDVFWAEFDIRRNSAGEFICRHDSFEDTPALPNEEWLYFDRVVSEVSKHNRAIKLDLKGGHDVLDRVLEIVVDEGFTDDRLWFNGDIETTREEGFRRIRAEHPDAIVQCPIAWLSPLIAVAPVEARKTLEMLTSWGISRFSVDWEHHRAREMFDDLVSWGYEVNFYSVPDLEAFLEAVLLLPSSVTSDFNFPQWHHYGHGSGQEGRRIKYAIDTEENG
jgi:hypothetical protein